MTSSTPVILRNLYLRQPARALALLKPSSVGLNPELLLSLGKKCCFSTSIRSCRYHGHEYLATAAPMRPVKAAAGSGTGGARSAAAFVDAKRVKVKAGNGGDGCISLASVFLIEFAGPDGGNGGNGGHVLFKASKEVSSLSHLKSQEKGPDGIQGGRSDCDGKSAEHRVIPVPLGTVFRNLRRDIVAELDEEGTVFLAAKGGAGGKGNAYFKKASNQTPTLAEAGGVGEEFTFDIELKTMADVGLIGFPNAGKSTLLRAVSRARPKVAAYPFTTLTPHIGMVPYEDQVNLSVADIPGLIPDAHKNKGLGISFLRHIERCSCLLFVIDMAQGEANPPEEQLEALKRELEEYLPGLSSRPQGIVANKMDESNAKESLQRLEKNLRRPGAPQIIPISAKFGTNVESLLRFVRYMCDQRDRLRTEKTQQLP